MCSCIKLSLSRFVMSLLSRQEWYVGDSESGDGCTAYNLSESVGMCKMVPNIIDNNKHHGDYAESAANAHMFQVV